MTTATRMTLDEYLATAYPFQVLPDEEGGFVVTFPDLPGCMTQVESLDEVPDTAEDARRLWIQTAFESGLDIPLPSAVEEYSGKFNLRIPRSLHRQLAQAAQREGVSLNQYVLSLLSRGGELARVEAQLDLMIRQMAVARPPVSGFVDISTVSFVQMREQVARLVTSSVKWSADLPAGMGFRWAAASEADVVATSVQRSLMPGGMNRPRPTGDVGAA